MNLPYLRLHVVCHQGKARIDIGGYLPNMNSPMVSLDGLPEFILPCLGYLNSKFRWLILN